MKISSPQQFILSRNPKEYLRQGLSHCGMYSIKAILSAYGKDVKNHPKEYHTNYIGQHFFSFALGERYNEKILEAHGLTAKGGSAEGLSNKEKILLLKSLLSENNPVMIRIGNGYLGCTYNPILGTFFPHWITLWGYDDDTKSFYVYDSALPEECRDVTLPIGDTTRTYKAILRDWNFGNKLRHLLSWNTSRNPYLYIEVGDHKN